MIPKDIMEKMWSKLTVKEYIMRTLIEGGRQTHGDGQNRAVWGATAIKSSIYIVCELWSLC